MFTAPKTSELRHLCKFRRWEDFPSGDTLAPDYDSGIHRWSKILPVKGSELYGETQSATIITHKLWTRWIPEVTNNHVVEYDGKRYRIHRVMNITENTDWYLVELELLGAINNG